MKQILVVSHCLLNTAAKVAQDESSLAEEYALRRQLLELAIANDVQLLQLPCPEFMLYGSRRWGHVKDQFVHPHFVQACEEMLAPVVSQLREYLTYPNDFEVMGIVSVEGSPSCGWRLTCRAPWMGELPDTCEGYVALRESVRMSEEPGVLMEVLAGLLGKEGLDVPMLTPDEAVRTITSQHQQKED